MQNEPPVGPTRRSARGLDWFVFFVADIQTGFGPFVAVYLTEQKWTQIDIGLLLTVSGVVALAGQMPGGALVDAAARSVWSPASPLRLSPSAPCIRIIAHFRRGAGSGRAAFFGELRPGAGGRSDQPWFGRP